MRHDGEKRNPTFDIDATRARLLARWDSENAAFEREYQATHVDDEPAKPQRERKPSDLLKSAEAAAQLNITTEQLIALVDDGALKAINVGRGKLKLRYRFDPRDIAAFKISRTLEAQPCPSLSPKNPRRTTGTASTSNVVGFLAQRAARLAKRPNGSKH